MDISLELNAPMMRETPRVGAMSFSSCSGFFIRNLADDFAGYTVRRPREPGVSPTKHHARNGRCRKN